MIDMKNDISEQMSILEFHKMLYIINWRLSLFKILSYKSFHQLR